MNIRLYLLFSFVFLIGSLHTFAQPMDEDFGLTQGQQLELLERHNHWRTEVGSPELEWSQALSQIAYGWGLKLREKGCKLIHSTNNLGENIFSGTANAWNATEVVDDWASEKPLYRYGGDINASNGHYTQVVWADTRAVGCAKVRCGNKDMWICNYDPAGNVEGRVPYPKK